MGNKSLNDSQPECLESMPCDPRMAIRSMAMSVHDLKNQLTAILLLAGRIGEETKTLAPGIQLLAASLLDEGKRMQGSIRRCMDMAATGLGDQPLQVSLCSLSNLLRQVVMSNWEYALSKAIRLRFLELGAGECLVQANEEELRTAVDNLVNNAIKYSFESSEVQVMISTHDRGGRSFASIRVRDQGPGLKPGDISRAFGLFQTLFTNPTGGESPSGLGLAIVRRVVDRHGGRVWIESLEGVGTSSCIDLPCASTFTSGERETIRGQTT